MLDHYTLTGLLVFRLIRGCVSPAQALWPVLLRLAMISIYAFFTLALASDWATYNESLGNMAVAVTCIHVGLVTILRVWRGPQALRPTWRGYAHTSG